MSTIIIITMIIATAALAGVASRWISALFSLLADFAKAICSAAIIGLAAGFYFDARWDAGGTVTGIGVALLCLMPIFLLFRKHRRSSKQRSTYGQADSISPVMSTPTFPVLRGEVPSVLAAWQTAFALAPDAHDELWPARASCAALARIRQTAAIKMDEDMLGTLLVIHRELPEFIGQIHRQVQTSRRATTRSEAVNAMTLKLVSLGHRAQFLTEYARVCARDVLIPVDSAQNAASLREWGEHR